MNRTRRDFAGLSVALLVAPGSVRAQRSAAVARVGVLETGSPSSFPDRIEVFAEDLQSLATSTDRRVLLEFRWAHGKIADLQGLAAELVRLNVDVIVAGTTAAALAAKAASSTVPVVFAVAADPVGVGLISSLAQARRQRHRVDDSQCRYCAETSGTAQGDRRRQAVPRRGPVLSGRSIQRDSGHERRRTRPDIGAVDSKPFPVNGAQDFEAAFSAMMTERIDALLVAAGALTDSHARRARRTRRKDSRAGDVWRKGFRGGRRAGVLFGELQRQLPARRGLCAKDPARGRARRSAGRAAEPVRTGDQPAYGQATGPEHCARTSACVRTS